MFEVPLYFSFSTCLGSLLHQKSGSCLLFWSSFPRSLSSILDQRVGGCIFWVFWTIIHHVSATNSLSPEFGRIRVSPRSFASW